MFYCHIGSIHYTRYRFKGLRFRVQGQRRIKGQNAKYAPPGSHAAQFVFTSAPYIPNAHISEAPTSKHFVNKEVAAAFSAISGLPESHKQEGLDFKFRAQGLRGIPILKH